MVQAQQTGTDIPSGYKFSPRRTLISVGGMAQGGEWSRTDIN
jgi:hypothetical protein